MARTLYGASGGDIIAQLSSDGDYEPAPTAVFDVMTTRTGSTALTDLQNISAVAITTVSPDANGRILFFGPDPYNKTLWLRNQASPSATRWRVDPVDVADRVNTLENASTSGAVLASTFVAEGDILEGTGSGTYARRAKGTALQYYRRNAANTANEWGSLPATTTPNLSGLGDVTITSVADKDFVRWDATAGVWVNDPASGVALTDGTGRLASGDWPLGMLRGAVINQGGTAPSYLVAGDILGVRTTVVQALTVTDIGGNAVSSNTVVTFTNTSGFVSGDYCVLCVTISGEAGAPTVSATGPTGLGALTAGPVSAVAASTAQSFMFYGKATATIATGQTFTVTASATRSDIAVQGGKLQGLVASSVTDQTNTGTGNNASPTVATGGQTAQASEIAVACFGWNATVGGNFSPTGGWSVLGSQRNSTDASPRSVVAVYRILTAQSTPSATGTFATAGVPWSAAILTFKGA
jgi:hypothetical protein